MDSVDLASLALASGETAAGSTGTALTAPEVVTEMPSDSEARTTRTDFTGTFTLAEAGPFGPLLSSRRTGGTWV